MNDIDSLGKFLSIIHRHSRAFMDRRLRHLGFGGGQFGFMMMLYKKDGINQTTLSEKLNLDKTTVTRSIRPLLDNGYMTRERDPEDRREYRLLLTEKGMSIRPELIEVKREMSQQLLEGLTPEERCRLMEMMERIAENARELE
jgi:DNA-binding MarR family transcriptional regulator